MSYDISNIDHFVSLQISYRSFWSIHSPSSWLFHCYIKVWQLFLLRIQKSVFAGVLMISVDV